MYRYITSLLSSEGIMLCRAIPLGRCKITKKYLLQNNGLTGSTGTVFIFAIPYVTRLDEKRNISLYAVSRDYHRYVSELSHRILPQLAEKYPEHRFCMFSDHSPIDERHAALASGLGISGMNGLVICEPYSSFFFICEIITDADCTEAQRCFEIKECIKCGACISACPTHGNGCLSEMTQRKAKLQVHEIFLMKESGSAWGCDLCQLVCPYTKAAIENGTIYSHIPYFCSDRLPYVEAETIVAMSDEEFSARAYSWRGKSTIMRNLAIINNSSTFLYDT